MTAPADPKRSRFPVLPGLFALAVAFAAAVIPVQGGAPADANFDGTWETILSCENAAGALGYSYKFPPVAKDGVLHGEKGARNKPGWLQIDGKVLADGSAKLYADGLVGASEAAAGRRPSGTQYGYHIDAKFADDSGTGKRVEGRPCSVTFAKKK